MCFTQPQSHDKAWIYIPSWLIGLSVLYPEPWHVMDGLCKTLIYFAISVVFVMTIINQLLLTHTSKAEPQDRGMCNPACPLM